MALSSIVTQFSWERFQQRRVLCLGRENMEHSGITLKELWLGGKGMNKGTLLRWIITALIPIVVLYNNGNLQTSWAMPKAEVETVRIGVNLGLTGGIASFGSSALKGMQLAVREANAEGGILGKQIQLVVRDNQSGASYAQEAMRQLIMDEKVVAVLGCIASSNTIAAVNWMEGTSNQVPVITPTGTNPRVTVRPDGRVRDFVFRACFVDPYQGGVMADFATKSLNIKRVAILTDNSSDYSKALTRTFMGQLAKNGGSVVGIQYYLQKDMDFYSILEQVIKADPDAIYVPGYYEEVGRIVRQARTMGYQKPMLGGDGWDSPKIVNIAGPDNLENTFFANHYSSSDPNPRVAKFIKEYKKSYREEPDALAALGYDAANLLIDAMRRSQEITPENVRVELGKTNNEAFVTGRIFYNRYHDPIKSAVIIRFINGQQVFQERINP
jgi:branched-chain amino acid transport system substrate-binding protein